MNFLLLFLTPPKGLTKKFKSVVFSSDSSNTVIYCLILKLTKKLNIFRHVDVVKLMLKTGAHLQYSEAKIADAVCLLVTFTY